MSTMPDTERGNSRSADHQGDYERARRRVERRRKFAGDVAAYVVINLFLIGMWLVTDRGYFWPGWVLGGWGVLLVLDAWNIYYRRPVTEADIDEEMRRSR